MLPLCAITHDRCSGEGVRRHPEGEVGRVHDRQQYLMYTKGVVAATEWFISFALINEGPDAWLQEGIYPFGWPILREKCLMNADDLKFFSSSQ